MIFGGTSLFVPHPIGWKEIVLLPFLFETSRMRENLKVNIVLSSEYVHNHVPFSHLVFHQGHVMRLKNQVEIQTFCKNPPSPQEFFKKTFHLSGSTISSYYITRYRMKDVSGILQFPFIAESDKKFSAK